MILTKAQAEAVYNAMLALNPVCGDIREIVLPDSRYGSSTIQVENAQIRVSRWTRTNGHQEEHHSSQDEFAFAYDLED